MSKFEPKITPFIGTGADLSTWCLRNVTENLRRFKAEFLRRYFDGESHSPKFILDAMLPDDPPKATGDDARDAERWRFLVSYKGTILNGCGVFALLDAGSVGHDVGYHYSLREAIDAAMAREQEAK